jgi:DNA-directed RNA polymerase specialized sigma24 family protein
MNNVDGGGAPPTAAEASLFTNTHWSQVLLAADPLEGTKATAALDYLCRTYWYPLYAFVRRSGYDADEAQDLTQAFFARFLEHNNFAQADPNRGRFRSFLLGALKNFLVMEWRKAHAAKRGGQRTFFSLDAEAAEERYRFEPASELTPENIYERRWALTLIDRVLARLQEEWDRAGKGEQFQVLKPYISSPMGQINYTPAAATLRMSTNTVAAAVYRMRRRCAELVREEIGHTVATAAELKDELRHLFSLLSA